MMIAKMSFLNMVLSLSIVVAQAESVEDSLTVSNAVSLNDSIVSENKVALASSNKDNAKDAPVADILKREIDEKIFKPGEAIYVRVYPDTTSFLNGFFKIDQFGNIDYPIIGTLCIKDLTKTELVEIIRKECVDYIRYPNIQVNSLIRVSLFGGFYKPGLQWVDSKSSLWDVIHLAGGVQREDGLKKIRWERDGEIVSKNLIGDFQAGSSLTAIGIKSGDQLCVTARPKITFGQSFRDNFMPFVTILLTTTTTAITAYQTYRLITEDDR